MKTTPLASAYPWDDFERVIILSPHLDDAVLSCGGFLEFLRARAAAGLVITVCSGNPPAVPTLVGQKEQRQGRQRKGHANPRLRRREDISAMHSVDADFVHLSFPDSIYRRSPLTGQFIYRDAKEPWVAPRFEDQPYIEELYLVLRRLCLNLGRILLISPMGIGRHVDHTIVAQAALRLAERGLSLLFYEDFPYVVDPGLTGLADTPEQALARLGLRASQRLVQPVDLPAKESLIELYRSQVPELFDSQLELAELLAARTYRGQPCEFYWRATSAGEEAHDPTPIHAE